MNMDRKYKEAENRTSEYLELKYGTDVQSGLSLAEVRRRRYLCGTYNIAKEKKRIWLICLKKECQNPFFPAPATEILTADERQSPSTDAASGCLLPVALTMPEYWQRCRLA